MDYKDIEALLDKYWACETSLDEEDSLKVFFQKEDIPEDILPYAAMFQYYQQMRSKKTSDNFEEKMKDRMERENVVGGKQRFLSRFYKVVAAVLLVLSFVLIHERYIRIKKEAISFAKDTFEDPQEALDEAKKVLVLVSSKMNQGTKTLAKINEFNKMEEIFDKSKTQ